MGHHLTNLSNVISKLLLKNLAADCWSVTPPFFNCDWHFWSPWNCFPFSAPCANTDFHALENSAATNFEPRLHNSATCICQCSRLVIFSPNRNRNVFAKQRTISVSHWLCCEFSPHLRLKKMTQWQGEVVGTERPFYRQMKLNSITIRLCNSVDQSNIFSLNNLEIHYMNFMFLIKTGKIGNSQKNCDFLCDMQRSACKTRLPRSCFHNWATKAP